ncbi:MAG: hypothetical protein J4F49_03655 [Rhodobacteraceae bacterium]|nr:hypothetical protein [Paracoccaceae bacterium]
MHSDFHYYGTYAIARATGLNTETCKIIATAAQFVDDNNEEKVIDFANGEGRINVVPTAHPLLHIDNSQLFDSDQRTVWLPFHFLPGNKGGCMSERLICRKDSEIARQMVDFCLSLAKKPFGFYLIGIATHVYADTFSHYGFSGVSSRWNKVDGNSITLLNDKKDNRAEDRFREKYGKTMGKLPNWRQSFLKTLQSGLAESGTGALGHGAVLKYPDYPYLSWQFSYEHPDGNQRNSDRDNLATYLDACEKLHGVFCRVGQDNPSHKDSQGRSFDSIRDAVATILKTQETDRKKREAAWEAASRNGDLFTSPESIPPYQGEEWQKNFERLNGKGKSSDVLDDPVFRFCQAAETYRAYVLRDLLPSHGLVVD